MLINHSDDNSRPSPVSDSFSIKGQKAWKWHSIIVWRREPEQVVCMQPGYATKIIKELKKKYLYNVRADLQVVIDRIDQKSLLKKEVYASFFISNLRLNFSTLPVLFVVPGSGNRFPCGLSRIGRGFAHRTRIHSINPRSLG